MEEEVEVEHTGSYSENLDVRGGNSKNHSPREDHKLHLSNLAWALCQIDISPKHSCCSRVHSIVDCRSQPQYATLLQQMLKDLVWAALYCTEINSNRDPKVADKAAECLVFMLNKLSRHFRCHYLPNLHSPV